MTEYSIAALRDYKQLLDEIEGTSQRIAGSMQAIRDLYNDPSFRDCGVFMVNARIFISAPCLRLSIAQ